MCKAVTLYSESPLNYVDNYYSASSYIFTYQKGIQSVKGKNQWNLEAVGDLPIVTAPAFTKSVGRRRKKRVRSGHPLKKPRTLTEEEQLEMIMKGVYKPPVAEQPEVVEEDISEVENQDSEEDNDFGELSPLDQMLQIDE
ncbi:hypothetical protein RCL1_008077 [Eukaryota sp. TZLM3-RCL]